MKLFTKSGSTANVNEIAEAYQTALAPRFRKGTIIQSPRDSNKYLVSKMAHLEHEVFAAVFLTNRHKIIEFKILFTGTIDATTIHAREVVKQALSVNAAAVILAHNHPSGDPTPSAADKHITKQLKTALELVDIRVLDHLVIGSDDHLGVISMANAGMM
jgi:DNA repair protein RadC